MMYEILIGIACGALIILLNLLTRPKKFWNSNGMGAFGPNSRRLGVGERMMAHNGETGILNLSNVIIIRSKKQLTEDIVYRALTALSQRNTILRIKLGRENGKFSYMQEMEGFKVNLKVCDTKDWQQVMEDEILKVVDAEKGPMWRVKFLAKTSYTDGNHGKYPYQSACVFSFHQIIADGPSYTMLFGQFTDMLHELLEGNEVEPVESRPLLPPVDAYIDNARMYNAKYSFKTNVSRGLMAFPFILRKMLNRTMETPLFVRSFGLESDLHPNAPKRTCIIPVELTREQTIQLLTSCKTRKVTVHCAVNTAACAAYCAIIDGGRIKKPHRISSPTSCNFRPHLDANELFSYFGSYSTGIMLETDIYPEVDFWDLVAKVSHDLQEHFKANSHFDFFTRLAGYTASEENLKVVSSAYQDLPGQRNCDLVFTNLGLLKHLDKEKGHNVRITACYGCSAEHQQGAVFANNLAAFNGKLFWTFVYYPHITNKTQAQQYANITIDMLLRLTRDSSESVE